MVKETTLNSIPSVTCEKSLALPFLNQSLEVGPYVLYCWPHARWLWHSVQVKDQCFVELVLTLASLLLVNMTPSLKERVSVSCFTAAWLWEYLVIQDSCVSATRGQEYLSVQFRLLSICEERSEGPPHQHFCPAPSPYPALALSGTVRCTVLRLWGTARSCSSNQQWKSYQFLYRYLNVQWAI